MEEVPRFSVGQPELVSGTAIDQIKTKNLLESVLVLYLIGFFVGAAYTEDQVSKKE